MGGAHWKVKPTWPYRSFIGFRSGKLVAIKEDEKRGESRTWLCKCDCGNFVVVRSGNLKHKNTQSCGCIKKFAPKYCYMEFYNTWIGIIGRCYKKKNKDYPNYGAKGIKMCSEWKNNYLVFHKWMEENGATMGLTVDRYPNKNGNYCPANCRIATAKQQQNNRNVNNLQTINGVTKTVAEWADQSIIKNVTIRKRLSDGWSIQDAITILPHQKRIQQCQ